METKKKKTQEKKKTKRNPEEREAKRNKRKRKKKEECEYWHPGQARTKTEEKKEEKRRKKRISLIKWLTNKKYGLSTIEVPHIELLATLFKNIDIYEQLWSRFYQSNSAENVPKPLHSRKIKLDTNWRVMRWMA